MPLFVNGVVVPSPECRTLHTVCKCGLPDGLDLASAQVLLRPVRYSSWRRVTLQ